MTATLATIPYANWTGDIRRRYADWKFFTWRQMMTQIRMVAVLALSLIGLGACADATSRRAPDGAGTDLGAGGVDSLMIGAVIEGAATSTGVDDAAGAPAAGQNRMHIGTPLRAN